jgi:uncharacterized protein YjaZ
MADHGAQFRSFIEQNNFPRKDVYEALGMSKQNFYQLFKSKVFTPETIAKIERVLKRKWEEIEKVNVDESMPPIMARTSSMVKNQDYKEKYIALLEEKIRTLQEQYDERLTVIERALAEARTNQQVMYAFQLAFQETALPLLAGQKKGILKEYGERTVVNLEKFQREGISVS